MHRLATAIGTGAIEVYEDFTRFVALRGPDDATIFQLIHQTGGAVVSQTQSALELGHTGFLLAANDFNTLLDKLLLLIAGRSIQHGGGFGKLLMDLHLVTRLALFGDEVDDLLDLLILYQRALRADGFGRARGLIKHVAFAE